MSLKNTAFPQLLKLLSRVIISLTLVLALTQAFAQQEAPKTNQPNANQQKSNAQNNKSKEANTETFEVFVPSEEILGDQSVDFPTDI